MKIGVILSAGGSAFERAFLESGLPSRNFHVVTDRSCAAEQKVENLGIDCERITGKTRDEMTEAAAAALRSARCDIALLHFSRLVGAQLYDSMLTFNVHPSLLPAFPGLDGVRDAFEVKTLYQGATLHLVDGGVDTGPIVAQTIFPVPVGSSLSWRGKLGYLQKTLVTLILFDLIVSKRIDPSRHGRAAIDLDGLRPGPMSNPGISHPTMSLRAAAMLNEIDEVR